MTQLKKSSYQSAVLLFWIFLASEAVAVNGYIDSHSIIRHFLYQSVEYPRDCQEIVNQCSSNNAKSGVYLIKPDKYPEPFEVYCDNNDTSQGGWTVIQQRSNGFFGYNRDWDDYKYGFGFLGSDFWIGNEKLAHLTNQNRYTLRINMENAEGQSYQVTYDDFRITDEWSNYSLFSVGIYDAILESNITWCVTNNQMKNGSMCQRSCENPDECISSNFLVPEGCVCAENHMIHGESCIPKEQCGCYVPEHDIILTENKSLINSACTWRITCRKNILINETHRCSNDAACETSNGFGNCTCNQWYEGNGVHCTRHPCYDEGKSRVLVEGESYVNSDCSSRIRCSNNRILETSYRCSSHATCEERNGVRNCTCNQWYVGDGVSCTRHPCYDEGKARVLAEGESYINSVCSTVISCSNNRLTRANYRGCHDDATCEETNGVGECNCNEWFVGDGVDTCTRNGPRDCYQLYRAGRRRNKVYVIYPRGSSAFQVYCEMSDGGWTILQRRTGRSISFYQNWYDYKYGFGTLGEDHWLGNDKIYKLTSQDTYQLVIEKTNSAGSSYHTRYSSFSISSEGSKYRLSLGTYNGNAGNDAMRASSGYRFSTYDQDNDGSSNYNCAEKHRGGWWYPEESGTGSSGYCYSFSNTVATGRYDYSGCQCHGYCAGCCYETSSRCDGCYCYGSQRYYKCTNCDGCRGWAKHRWCSSKNQVYSTTYYSCGYSNVNGDYQYSDNRGIFWEGLHGSDCGITQTTMKIRPT